MGVKHLRKQSSPEGEPLWRRFFAFLGRQGFYLTLLLCVGVIGLTALIFSSTWRKASRPAAETGMSVRLTAPPLTTWLPADAGTEEPAETWSGLPEAAPEPEDPPEPGLPETEDPDAPAAAETMAQVFRWPLSGEIERGYAWDRLVYDRTMGDWRTHDGLDIAGGLGARVCAAADGVVEQIYEDERMGTVVVLYHGGGLRSLYANLAAVPTVQVGDEIRVGDVLGSIGTTALAERGDVTHLHFGMSVDGVDLDPTEYMPSK
jgi:murein DD-endopeptidase MepM/ murein hydrolase activator NlpD